MYRDALNTFTATGVYFCDPTLAGNWEKKSLNQQIFGTFCRKEMHLIFTRVCETKICNVPQGNAFPDRFGSHRPLWGEYGSNRRPTTEPGTSSKQAVNGFRVPPGSSSHRSTSDTCALRSDPNGDGCFGERFNKLLITIIAIGRGTYSYKNKPRRERWNKCKRGCGRRKERGGAWS